MNTNTVARMPEELADILRFANLVTDYAKTVYGSSKVELPEIPEHMHHKAHAFLNGLTECVAQALDDNGMNYFKTPIEMSFKLHDNMYLVTWDTDRWTCRKIFKDISQ